MDTTLNPTARRDVPAALPSGRAGDGYAGTPPALAERPLAGLSNLAEDGRTPQRIVADAQWAHAEIGRMYKGGHKAFAYILGYGLAPSFRSLPLSALKNCVALARAVAAPMGVIERVILAQSHRVTDSWAETMHRDLYRVRFCVYVEDGERVGVAWTTAGPRLLVFAPLPNGSLPQARHDLATMAERALDVLGEVDDAKKPNAEVLA